MKKVTGKLEAETLKRLLICFFVFLCFILLVYDTLGCSIVIDTVIESTHRADRQHGLFAKETTHHFRRRFRLDLDSCRHTCRYKDLRGSMHVPRGHSSRPYSSSM